MSVVSHRFLLLVVNEAPYRGQQKCYTEAFAVLLFAFGVSGLALTGKGDIDIFSFVYFTFTGPASHSSRSAWHDGRAPSLLLSCRMMQRNELDGL